MDTTPSPRRRLRILVLALLGSIGLLVVSPSVGFASADVPPEPAVPTTADNSIIDLPASTVTLLLAVIIPVVGGLVLKTGASEKVKAAVGIVLSAIASLLATATTEGGDAILSASLVNNFIITVAVSVATLYGVYKPTGADAALKSTGGLIGPKTTPNGA